MKLVDAEETILVVVPADAEADHPDLRSAEALREAIDQRGGGWPYRRALVVRDEAWFGTPLFHGAPTIAVGGPGVNGVSGQFAAELPSVWSEHDQLVIQARMDDGVRRATLWGTNRQATAMAVEAFIDRGWLDEFLDRCWRFSRDQNA